MPDTLAVSLDELAYLRVRGADAASFLQGQLSSDLRLLSEARAQISSYSTPKGRMLAVLQLFRRGDDVLLEVHRSVAEATLKRLRMFVLRAKLVIEDVSAELPALGLIGAGAGAALAAQGLPVPAQPLDSAAAGELVVIRRLGALPRYSVHGREEALRALRPTLRAGGFVDWKRADLLAGVPTVYPETREFFVPQMANLDLLGGVSFNKGCYTGQEIVARLHYLGQLKRRLFLAQCETAEVRPGQPLYAASGESQAVGEVVDAVPEESGGSLFTAVLQLSHAESPQLRLGSPEGPPLTLLRNFVS